MTESALLIRNAELMFTDGSFANQDVRVRGATIQAVGNLQPEAGERIVQAKGCLLVPGLQDHHVHLASFAASLNSVRCGPPEVKSADELRSCLHAQPGTGWLRGTGFHDTVLPGLDKHWLDRHGPDRPIRLQHRSGRLWIMNSAGLDALHSGAAKLSPLEQRQIHSDDGRLYDLDALLGKLIPKEPPAMGLASKRLAAYGITGVTDMTPTNDLKTWEWFAQLQASHQVLQKVRIAGQQELVRVPACQIHGQLTLGETKVHLHDSALPELQALINDIVRSHEDSRCVAIHCVTEVELVFALAAYREAGVRQGDRIEHASVVPTTLVEQLLELRLGVITQPNFVRERGDTYLQDIPKQEHVHLYRVASLIAAGVPVAFGTDSPFGTADPWVAMKAAVDRLTPSGAVLGAQERIAPEQALNGFLGELADPFTLRTVAPAANADLCLLDQPWQQLRSDLSSSHVRTTFRDGEPIYSRDGTV